MSEKNARSARSAAALAATLVAVFMIAAQVAGKATRDAYFLSLYPASDLPSVMAASAALSIATVLIITRAMTRFSPVRVVPVVFLINAVLFVGEWALSYEAPRVAAVAVYLHTASLGATVISSFWSLVNERFDPHTAKKVVGRVAAGAALGGVVGGVAAWLLAREIPLPSMLLVLAAATTVGAIGTARIGEPRRSTRGKDSSEESTSGSRVLREVPYLRQLALLVVLAALGEATIDYVLKANADARFTSDENLITFFAVFHMSTAVVAFALQTSLAKRVLGAIGLAGTVAILPGVVVAGGVVALFFPGLWSAVGLRGGAATIQNSFYRSGYELLYTPLTPAKKRPTKTLIDVGFERLGMAVGAGLVMIVLAVAADSAHTILLATALATALAALAVTSLLHAGYVAALADSLRSGFVKLDEEQVIDRTTHRTLSNTTMALDREKLLREIAAMRARSGHPDPREEAETIPEMPAIDPDDPIVRAIADLRSGNARRIRSRLGKERDLNPLLVPYVIQLLGDERVLRDATASLRPVAKRATGQLIDTLLDPNTDDAIRRRIPRVLSTCTTQRAADGLMLGLVDERFEVRDWCAVALVSITEKDSSIRIHKRTVFAAAQDEAERAPGRGVALGNRRIEHIFRILSLVLDREPLKLAYRAVGLDDEVLRGTGLEYLENVLPGPLSEALSPHLGKRPRGKVRRRPEKEIVDELLTSMSGVIKLPR